MGDETAKLAVIINCYNYKDYIRSATQSVLSQNVVNFEVIIIDDGSTDRSWEIIKSLPVKSFRKNNGGQVSACRYGLSKTTAPFIIFLDADDELVPGSLQKIMSLLDEDVSKIQFPLLKIDSAGSQIGPAFPLLARSRDRKSFINAVEKAGSYVSPPTSGNVFRRDVCDLLNDASYDSAVDGVILLAAPFYGDVVSLDEPLGRYRVHGRNKSGTNQTPSTILLRKQQKRFVDRVNHLRTVLAERGKSCNICDPERMYIYLRYENYCDIIEKRRIGWKNCILALKSIPQWYNTARKVSTMLFLTACLLLPNGILNKLVDARLNSRSGDFIRKIIYLRAPRL